MRFSFLLITVMFLACNTEKIKEQEKDIIHLNDHVSDLEEQLFRQRRLSDMEVEKYMDKADSLRKELEKCNGLSLIHDTDIKIFPLRRIHNDELKGASKVKQWVGLFKRRNQDYFVKTVEVQFKQVHDPIVDEKGEKTGWFPQIVNTRDTCLFIISGTEILPNNKIRSVYIYERSIKPGHEWPFEFGEYHYKLFAEGNPISYDHAWVGQVDYKLYLQEGTGTPQLIVEQKMFDESKIEILWLGDLDNDGHLDLILNISDHSNAAEYSLLLSIPSNNGQLVTQVATNRFVGC